MTKSGTLFYFFLFSIFLAFAQNAKVTGFVYDGMGQPVSFVNIEVKNTTSKTTTNSTGYFEIEIPSNEDVILVFYHTKFNIHTEKFNLKQGQEVFKSIRLILNSIPEIIIEPKPIKRKRNDNFFEVDSKSIEDNIGIGGNTEAVLFSEASVNSNNELSSQYSVRGGNFDENLVYVNDIQVYRPFLVRSGQQEGLSFTNAELVDNLSFSAGGFGAKYGDKMSSVLDIKYRNPDSLRAGFTTSLLGATFHIENKHKRFEYLVGTRYKSNAYVLNSLDTKGEYKPSFFDVQTYLTYHLNENWRLSFLGNLAENKFRMLPVSRTTSFGTVQTALRLRVFFDGEEKDEFNTYFGALTSEHDIGKNTFLKFIVSGFQSQESETFDIDGAYLLNEVESNFGSENFGESTYQIGVGRVLSHSRNYLTANVFNFSHKGTHVHKNMTLYWGAKIQREIFEDEINEWKLIDSSGYSIPQAPNDAIELFEVLKTKINLSSNRSTGYVQSDFASESDKYFLSTGIRFNHWDYNNQTTVSPRAIVSYNPKPDSNFVKFRFATGFYHQPPFYRELRNMSGQLNPALRAQSSIHFVFGTDYYFTAWDRDFKFTGEMYYKHLNHLVPYIVDNVRIRYTAENNSKGYAAGVEFKVFGDFVKGMNSWFTIGLMQTKEDIQDDFYYTYSDASGNTVPANSTSVADSSIVYPGFIPRPTEQLLNLGIHFQDEMPRWPALKVHLSLLYGSGLPYGAPSSPKYQHVFRMPSYRRLDVGFSYNVIEQGKLRRKGDLVKIPDTHLLKGFHAFAFRMEVFNLLKIENTISYFWVNDISGNEFGVPNFLTSRLVNFKIIGRI